MRRVEAAAREPETADQVRELPGFERVERHPHTLFVRSEWKGFLQEDVLGDFAGVSREDRRVYSGGRGIHFSYKPFGASKEVFVRKVWRGGVLGRLLGDLHFNRHRPIQECVAARRAARAGLSVAEPIALRMTRVGPACYRFLVVTPAWPNATSLSQLRQPLRERRSLLLRLAREVRGLHDAGVYPEDLTLNNILMEDSEFCFVDFDRSVILGGWTRKAAIRNLSRLNRSCEKIWGGAGFLSATDKLRFLRRYLEDSTGLASMAEACEAGLWRHRVWWFLRGERERTAPSDHVSSP
jgi:hypothetical protein